MVPAGVLRMLGRFWSDTTGNFYRAKLSALYEKGGESRYLATKGSRTRMVSSRSGLVESSATGAPISSSTRRIYLIAVAGSSAHERAPRVDPLHPSRLS